MIIVLDKFSNSEIRTILNVIYDSVEVLPCYLDYKKKFKDLYVASSGRGIQKEEQKLLGDCLYGAELISKHSKEDYEKKLQSFVDVFGDDVFVNDLMSNDLIKSSGFIILNDVSFNEIPRIQHLSKGEFLMLSKNKDIQKTVKNAIYLDSEISETIISLLLKDKLIEKPIEEYVKDIAKTENAGELLPILTDGSIELTEQEDIDEFVGDSEVDEAEEPIEEEEQEAIEPPIEPPRNTMPLGEIAMPRAMPRMDVNNETGETNHNVVASNGERRWIDSEFFNAETRTQLNEAMLRNYMRSAA